MLPAGRGALVLRPNPIHPPMPIAHSSLDPSSLAPWDIAPGLDAPLDVVQALYAAAVDRLRADPALTAYADALLAEEFSAAHFAWLARAPAAKLVEVGREGWRCSLSSLAHPFLTTPNT